MSKPKYWILMSFILFYFLKRKGKKGKRREEKRETIKWYGCEWTMEVERRGLSVILPHQ